MEKINIIKKKRVIADLKTRIENHAKQRLSESTSPQMTMTWDYELKFAGTIANDIFELYGVESAMVAYTELDKKK